jgi:hypothetical protein
MVELGFVITSKTCAINDHFSNAPRTLLGGHDYARIAFFWCELAHQPKGMSYPFLLLYHHKNFGIRLKRYCTKIEFTLGDTTLWKNGFYTIFPDVGSKNIMLEGENNPTVPIITYTYRPPFTHLAHILRDKRALAFYHRLKLEEIGNSIYEGHKHELDKYPWLSKYKEGGALMYAERHEWVQTLLALTMAGADFLPNESILEKINLAETFEKAEWFDDRISFDWGITYRENDITPYSTGLSPHRNEKEMSDALILPYLQVARSVFENDEDGFNTHLRIALEKHKDYYTHALEYGKPLNGDPTGWVSMRLCSICAIAHDRGLRRTVQSDYIPEWMVCGEFEGLLPIWYLYPTETWLEQNKHLFEAK